MFYRIFVLLFFVSLHLQISEGITCSNQGMVWQDSCLYFNNTNVSGFVVAERHCQEIGGHLISVHDAFTNAFIGEKAGELFSNWYDFWIGGNTLMGGSSNWSWTDGSPFGYADWTNGEPDNTPDKQCVLVSKDHGYWSTEDCSKQRPFVCSVSYAITQPPTRPPPSTQAPTVKPQPAYRNCTFGWIYFEPTNSCYGYNNQGTLMSWSAAETYCKSQGAHLASIHSYEEEMFVNEFALFAWRSIWLGLYSIDQGNTWIWTDGTRFDYSSWYNGQPSQIYSGQNCVLLESSTTRCGFETKSCSTDGIYPLCKKPYYA